MSGSSILGIDLGAHSVYVSVFTAETGSAEVLCDDSGLRSFPAVVAFRRGGEDNQGIEVLVGHSALQQQVKNASNTFDNIRSLLLNASCETVFVPALEKEITIQELSSHLFRNVFNQVKQQSSKGHSIRDCIICLPSNLDETVQQRVIEAARAGGVRIKGFCAEASAALVAHNFDVPNGESAVVAVVDVGSSNTSISFLQVSNGIFFPLFSNSSHDICIKGFISKLVDFCSKDFTRKMKVPCAENKRAIMRLAIECEKAVKILSNSQEAVIVVDSLCEGLDYSAKISRSRFEDLCGISTIALREFIKSSISAISPLDAGSITHLVLCGMNDLFKM